MPVVRAHGHGLWRAGDRISVADVGFLDFSFLSSSFFLFFFFSSSFFLSFLSLWFCPCLSLRSFAFCFLSFALRSSLFSFYFLSSPYPYQVRAQGKSRTSPRGPVAIPSSLVRSLVVRRVAKEGGCPLAVRPPTCFLRNPQLVIRNSQFATHTCHSFLDRIPPAPRPTHTDQKGSRVPFFGLVLGVPPPLLACPGLSCTDEARLS